MINIIVSACLLGEPCRYDGASKPNEAINALREMNEVRLIPICPEVQGGLPTPRPASEVQADGRVVNMAGEDVTAAFREGAQKALEDAINTDAWIAILKAKSPSCGSGLIYDGSFSQQLKRGWGVAAALLRENGVKVFDENAFIDEMRSVHALDESDWNNKIIELLRALEAAAQKDAQDLAGDQDSTEERLQEKIVEPEENRGQEAGEVKEYVAAKLPAITAKKAWGHFKTITKHKVEVAKLCFKIGMIGQGLRHDLSKYTPAEFGMGARFYQGFRSPNAAERECRGFTEAWLHHKGRNKHHFEYWLDLSDDPEGRLKPAPMPTKYVLEMLCDRIAASKTYKGSAYTNKDPYEYFDRSRGYVIMHPYAKAQIEGLLRCLYEEGEDAVIEKARKMYTESKRK